MSAFHAARDELSNTSLSQKLAVTEAEDSDSGFHELIDDASVFELSLPKDSASSLSALAVDESPLQILQQEQEQGQAPAQFRPRAGRSGAADSGGVVGGGMDSVSSAASFSSATTPEYSPVSVSPSSPRPPLSNGTESVSSSTSTQPDGGPSSLGTTASVQQQQQQQRGENGGGTSGSPVPSPAGSVEDVSGKESDDAFEEAGNSSPEEDELGEHWNPDLYTLQSQAPHPEVVVCTKEIENRPPQFGPEYHGTLSREDAADLLGTTDGRYLIRNGSDGDCILSFMLGGRMWNFRMFYEDKCHFVGEKRFEDIHELVEDGLITVFLSQNNVMQALEKGRDLTRKHSKKLRRKPCGRVKGPKGKGKSAYLERLRSGSFESLPSPPQPTGPVRMMSTPAELDSIPVTPNSNQQQSDLDLTTPSERRGNSTSTLTMSKTTTKSIKGRRAFSSDSLQQKMSHGGNGNNRSNPVATLRDVVRAERESLSQSMEVSILSEKAASILGIAPPKQYKRASMYDPLMEKRINSETPAAPPLSLQARSHSFHPGLKRGKAFDKSAPRESRKSSKKPPVSPSPYYKAHKFKPVTYVHPTWCVICHHFLWGLKMQGLRCQDCGIDIHRQCCAESLDHECNPTKKMVKRMFGVDLTTRVKVEETAIPSLLQRCIQHIENSDLEEQGLYRVSGLTSEILDLKDRFDSGDKIDFSRYADLNVVCGAVKLYLRELPIPVITFDAYNEVMKATSGITDPNEEGVDWTPLANALKLLPKAHYNTLKYLMEHLHRVDSKSDVNKMTCYNLSVVFAPTLMRSPTEDMSLVKDIPLQRHFVEILILKHKILFSS